MTAPLIENGDCTPAGADETAPLGVPPADGIALGVATHLWRDLAEPAGSGVALFWPISTRTWHTPSMIYLLSIALLAVAAYGRATQWTRLSVPLVGHP